MSNWRQQSYQILTQVICKGHSLAECFDDSFVSEHRPLIQAAIYGTLRDYIYLQELTTLLLKKPLKEKDEDVLVLICFGLFQLRTMNQPSYASVNETVELIKKKKPWVSKLVNAVLQRFRREQPAIEAKADHSQHNHPNWLLSEIKQAWPNHWQQITEANNTAGPLFLRVNQRKITPDAYLAQCLDLEFPATLCEHPTGCIKLPKAVPVHELPGFHEGFASVQDQSGQLLADIIDNAIQQPFRLLDACAAPGGKLAEILERFSDSVDATALELKPKRFERLQSTLIRLELKASCKNVDATQVDRWWDQTPFDVIVLDAPCSGSGVIRRHPDLRLLRRRSDMNRFAEQQQKLLQALWPTLKPSGQLIYITCSILPQENDETITQFLKSHTDCKIQPLNLPQGQPTQHGCQILPSLEGGDGFYYACLQKI